MKQRAWPTAQLLLSHLRNVPLAQLSGKPAREVLEALASDHQPVSERHVTQPSAAASRVAHDGGHLLAELENAPAPLDEWEQRHPLR